MNEPEFYFQVGESYRTQGGTTVKIVARDTTGKGAETIVDEHGLYRYDRRNNPIDAGRLTGSDHDYSHALNLARPLSEVTRVPVTELEKHCVNRAIMILTGWTWRHSPLDVNNLQGGHQKTWWIDPEGNEDPKHIPDYCGNRDDVYKLFMGLDVDDKGVMDIMLGILGFRAAHIDTSKLVVIRVIRSVMEATTPEIAYAILVHLRNRHLVSK